MKDLSRVLDSQRVTMGALGRQLEETRAENAILHAELLALKNKGPRASPPPASTAPKPPPPRCLDGDPLCPTIGK